MALTNKLTAIADAIREKTGTTDLLTLDAMPAAISRITTGSGGEGSLNDYIPESAFTITDDCSYRFSNNGWNWFVKKYGDRITTSNITNAQNMFSGTNLEEVPFDINLNNTTGTGIERMFMSSGITKTPYIKGKTASIQSLFNDCKKLVEIPEDWADYIDWSYTNSYQYANNSQVFSNCYSLKRIPQNLVDKLNSTSTSNLYMSMFSNCYVLEEVNKMPVWQVTLTSNKMNSFVANCYRLKNFTFATQEDGTPYSVNWKSQTFDLSGYIGCVSYSASEITSNNSGITADKEVKDDATYQALKDDPDWFTCNRYYSRYNHDSAVATINSLPDTSAYLATAGGTNTIKFNVANGYYTDGGAINNLTAAEIAVATAKGWTVSLSGSMPGGIGGQPSLD